MAQQQSPTNSSLHIITDDPSYKAAGKLQDQVALITGGDSGIGAAVAIAFAKEGARVAIMYIGEDQDGQATASTVKQYGSEALLLKGDAGIPEFCDDAVKQTVQHFGRLDIVVNNAGTQQQRKTLLDISPKQLQDTFRTNIFSMFYVSQAALPHLKKGASIINTASVVAYLGHPELIDYSATKSAIVGFTRSLASNLAPQGIRVNGVAPGPVWTQLVITSFDQEKLQSFGKDQPLGRVAQPYELAPAYVYLASRDAQYVTGQMLHVNGGEIVNG